VTDRIRGLVRLGIVAVGTGLAGAVGWVLFVWYPDSFLDVAGVLLTGATALVGAGIAAGLVRSRGGESNVAEVAVEGPITRSGGGGVPRGATSPGVDRIVDRIERADEDQSIEALLVRLNTPGGEVVPSEDVRSAAAAFDGPTVAFATDTCASGGYWIACGCDEVWAREGSVVGSIGVIGSRPNVADLATRLGVSYERFAAGKYKDAGIPLKELDADDRAYLQGIIDDYYEQFVETVVEGRELDEQTVRDTEARVYLGPEARNVGLVDELGDRDAVEARLEDLVDGPVEVREFTPQRRLTLRLTSGVRTVAAAFGAGLAGRVDDDPLDVRVGRER
jgi:protease-4